MPEEKRKWAVIEILYQTKEGYNDGCDDDDDYNDDDDCYCE